MRTLLKLLRAIGVALLVPILLFEEWGWEPLAALVARLARLPFWAWLERHIRSLPPWAALLTFFVPVLMLLPVKLLGLFLLAGGHGWSALMVLLGAKVVGTAIVARLFQLVEPALMRIGVFARWYPRWKAWKDGVLTTVKASAVWRTSRRLGARCRSLLIRWRTFFSARD